MIELIPEWTSNIHPLIVHFPIAILLLAVLMDVIDSTSLLPENWWNKNITTILYGVGSLSAIGAYYTGTIAADTVFLPAQAQTTLNNHADWALWTVWFFSIYTIVRIVLHWFDKVDIQVIHIGLILLVLPGVFFLYETGDHGSKMVYGYGVGTGNLLAEGEQSLSMKTDSIKSETDFIVRENGGWTWQIGEQSLGTLSSRFDWLIGSRLDVNPEIVRSDDNMYLQLILKDPTSSPILFVEKSSLKNVQVDYWIDMSQFEGQVMLVNHLADTSDYDFVTLNSDNSIVQGRVVDGERETFGKGTYSASGLMFVRTVVNGTHFRVYIDEKMAVHGHGDAPSEGRVGLRMEGSGSILINKIIATDL